MSDASFVLDVVAQMAGGEQTTAQLEALSGKLVAAGVSAGTLHDAIASASNSLVAAKVAAGAASAALAEGNTKYRELEQAANQAAKAQEKAAKSGVVQPEVAAAAMAASAALSAHETQLAKLETSAKEATAKENALAESLTNVKKLATATAAENVKAATAEAKATALARKNIGDLKSGFAELGGPLGFIGQKSAAATDSFNKLSEQFGTGSASALFAASGVAAVAAAVVVVTIAVIAATIAVAAWAIGLADAARSASLNQKAVEALDPSIAALSGSFASIMAQTGQTAPQLDALTKSLVAAKVSAADMPEALRAAALAEAALGQGGSADFLADIKAGKVAVSELSATVQSKLGGIVAKQMLGLTAQTQTFHNNISNLFGGLDIEPALTGLSKLVGLLDENTAAGSAIKFLFDSIFQPLINQADNAATVIEAFALGFLIGLMNVYLAVKPVLSAVEKLFGFKDASLATTLGLVTKAGEYIAPVFVVLAVVFGVVVAAVIAVVAVLTVLGAAFVAPIYAVIALGVAIEAGIAVAAVAIANFVAGLDIVTPIRNAWTAVTAFFAGIDLSSVGTSIIEGLASGITNAAGAVLSAIGGVVTGAISSAHDLLDINSPSKVFKAIGGSVGEGFAGGIDDSAPDAQSSLEQLVNPSSAAAGAGAAGAASASARGGSAGGSAASVVLNLTINGVKDAEQAVDQIKGVFVQFLEDMALQSGGGAPA